MKFYQRIVCADGFSMSVQASSFSYCSPRIDSAAAYEACEIGYPTARDSALEEYAEDPEAPIMDGQVQTVYPWVPASVIQAVIQKHGGQTKGECPPLALQRTCD